MTEIGIKYNSLLIIREVEPDVYSSGTKRKFLCQCDCGKELTVRLNSLKTGNTKSCGCVKTQRIALMNYSHGLRNHKLYKCWSGMKERCYNPKSISFKNYGGRGITICDKWLNDFKSFYDWAMANGFDKDLSIDRVNNDGNYEPGNCRWATDKQQRANQRRCVA